MSDHTPHHRDLETLQAGLDAAVQGPRDAGPLQLIVRRPEVGEREVLERAMLDTAEGLVGDSWSRRPSSRTEDGGPHPGMQLTLISSRVIDLIAGSRERWPLAGDQLYVDFDLGADSVPPGTRLMLGEVLIEITAEPHTGCGKFIDRFGADAMRLVNSPDGRRLGLRGVNARVLQGGPVEVGALLRRAAE